MKIHVFGIVTKLGKLCRNKWHKQTRRGIWIDDDEWKGIDAILLERAMLFASDKNEINNLLAVLDE